MRRSAGRAVSFSMEEHKMDEQKQHGRHESGRSWLRIPDGTKVRYRQGGHEGSIDGLTEIVSGPNRNPDGKTQYRVYVGAPERMLAVEDDLLILADRDGLVLIEKGKIDYRREVTQQLRSVHTSDRFVV
jgi:hypothetical protein